jgi:hypothetical protein
MAWLVIIPWWTWNIDYPTSDIHTRGQKGKFCDPCDLEVAPYDYLTTDIHTREIL